MKAKETIIAWTPNTEHYNSYATKGLVKVGPLIADGMPDWTSGYRMTGGAAYINIRSIEGWQAKAMVLTEFVTIVVRDLVDPAVAHRAFIEIDEYAEIIAEDIEGAR
ncbi:hypothetical protein [Methylobrevis albus]|uniref:Uncharacterized protein n=1 Tax=Methylobrevis albus TaxID=2793297 RepID=A0A931I610_9HYPH|nr:hypothetical protein [Methylobrevis albus]MBH0239473.1 hypothetical protein [Methylobrevis albus]